MKIIGNGQLARIFTGSAIKNTCILAGGVSNSSCSDTDEFKREKDLLLNAIYESGDKKIVYFSSCVVSTKNYELNEYYRHKISMEKLVQENTHASYIFRLPQLFGDLMLHNTLINYIYQYVEQGLSFSVFDEAYRYVIEINDVRTLVEAYLKYSEAGIVVDLANPYRYRVLDIVEMFETLLNKKANYQLIKKDDQYKLDLSSVIEFIEEHNIEVDFGKDYLMRKLSQKLKRVK